MPLATKGTATARRLLAEGWHVRARTRDTPERPFESIGPVGVELVKSEPAAMEERLVGRQLRNAVQHPTQKTVWTPPVCGSSIAVRQDIVAVLCS